MGISKLFVRSLSGIAVVIVILAGLLINQWVFAALTSSAMILMMAEFQAMTMGDRFPQARFLSVITALCCLALMFAHLNYGLPIVWMSTAFIPLVGTFAAALFSKDRGDFGVFSSIAMSLLYIALPCTLALNMVLAPQGFDGTLMLAFFIIIWCSDVGAYIFGMALGQRFGGRLCPEVSPKKSWIGFWGGLLCAVIAAVVLSKVGFLPLNLPLACLLGLVMSIAGVCGDLFESQWKRICGVKDSGNLIPGHGGLLDRFDSALFAFPLGYVIISLLG